MCQNDRARTVARPGFFGSSVLLLLVCAGLLPAIAQATTAAGRTKGAFAVSPTTGAATYTIPIWAPPGPQGMQPNIALTYNSQQGNGPLGVGWGLSGLSSIYRCNLTFAQDAAPAPVALVTGDGYCMDGKRLRLTAGTYGTAGSTYQTEIADFSNVTASGTAGNGPAYFTIQGRDGLTYTYGNTTDSRVIAPDTSTALSWQLNEVSDRVGNTMTISYTTATGATVPATISWTPSSHGSGTYNYTMTFAYTGNVPQSSIYKYVAGSSVQNINLLSSITIAYSGTTVKKYLLSYQASPTTKRDELIEVQECADSGGTNCLLPTTITYQNGQAGTSTSATSALSSAPSQLVALFDFNGDGLMDLAYCNGSTIYVSFASATGYGAPVNSGAACGALYGNLLGNGQDAILANHSGTWYYYTWNGSSFTGTSTGLAYDSSATQYLIADIDGDGRPDLIELVATPAVGYSIYTRLNTSSTTSVSFSSTRVTALSGSDTDLVDASIASASNGAIVYGTLRRLDFNGDGREDILFHIHDQTTTAPQGSPPPPGIINIHILDELLSNGSTFTPFQIVSANSLSNIAFLNWNSDACTDYVVNGGIYISGCNGSGPSGISLGSSTVIGAMDWDGDGRTDVLVANGSTIGVYLSTGDGISNLVTTSVPYSASDQYFTFDANGDGLDEIGVWNQTTHAVSYFAHNAGGQPPDLVSSVTDGFGNSASPTYVSIVQHNYTEHIGAGADAVYPYEDYIGPMYVVSEAVFSDPSSSGATYNQTFSYYTAWTNLQGRGFSGFNDLGIIDSRTPTLMYVPVYGQDFPYTGMLDGYEVLQKGSNGEFSVFVEQDSYTLATTTLNSTHNEGRVFPYASNITKQTSEVGGAENGDLITTASTNYTIDNYGNATQIATTVTDNDPNSPYPGSSWTTTTTNTPDVDTTHWCLSLFTETQVAYSSTLSGSNSVTRTKTPTPDTTNCRYTQIVTEPNSSQFKVTEALAYDSFGNVNSDTVTGVGMTARVTGANWGTTGQFINTLTDPSNATTTWTYSSTQSLGFGVPDSVKDANNLTTSWLYDGFGRKTKETRPDGTYTVWTPQNCAGTSGCLVGSNGLVVGHTVYNTDGSYQSSGTDYLDPVDRSLVWNQAQLSGYSRNEVRYEPLGNVHQRAFPCTWSSLTTTCTYWTTNSYDPLNRLTQSQRPISSTNSNLQTTSYAYAGRTTTVTDALSNARTLVTDVNGWLRQTKDPYSYTATLSYDSAGSKTGVKDSAGNTLWSGTYNYGLAPYLASSTDVDIGAWSFTQDALGELTAGTDAKSQSFSATYDALSRPLTRGEPDYFTQWTWGSSASSHNIGKLQSVCTGTGSGPTNCTTTPGYSENETYDSLGRRSQRTMTLPGEYGGTFSYTWAYNATTGLLNTLTYPASYPSTYSLQLQYAYSNGILQSVTDVSDTPNVTVWTANTMNPAGQITEETLGNGIVTNRSYDAVTSWLGSAQSGIGGGAGVKNLAFLYDEMGDVTQRQDNNLGLTENIYYDNEYRFSYSKLNGTQNLSVTYATNGNITSRSDVASGASWTYSPTQIHAVTQAGSSAYQYSYDANGNAKTRQGSSIVWSSYNYPTSISAGSGSTAETVTLSYGPDRQRWQQYYSGNSTTETTDYVGKLLEVVAGGGVTDFRHYVFGGAGAVAVYSRKSNGTNTFSYVLSDHQASVASITNSSGGVVVGESFTAFGNRRNPTTWSGSASNSDLTTTAGISRQGYTFQTQLGLWMGMNHMNGRAQDGITGRFLSADRYIPDPSNTQSYNRYSYTNNNPVTRIDPSGFDDANIHCKRSRPGYRRGYGTSTYGSISKQSRMKLDPFTVTPIKVTAPDGTATGYTLYIASSGYVFSTGPAGINTGDPAAAFATPYLAITPVNQPTSNEPAPPTSANYGGYTGASPPNTGYSQLVINNDTGAISPIVPNGATTLSGTPVERYGPVPMKPVGTPDVNNDEAEPPLGPSATVRAMVAEQPRQVVPQPARRQPARRQPVRSQLVRSQLVRRQTTTSRTATSLPPARLAIPVLVIQVLMAAVASCQRDSGSRDLGRTRGDT